MNNQQNNLGQKPGPIIFLKPNNLNAMSMPANNFNTNQTNLPYNNVPNLNKQFSTNLDGSLDYEGQQQPIGYPQIQGNINPQGFNQLGPPKIKLIPKGQGLPNMNQNQGFQQNQLPKLNSQNPQMPNPQLGNFNQYFQQSQQFDQQQFSQPQQQFNQPPQQYNQPTQQFNQPSQQQFNQPPQQQFNQLSQQQFNQPPQQQFNQPSQQQFNQPPQQQFNQPSQQQFNQPPQQQFNPPQSQPWTEQDQNILNHTSIKQISQEYVFPSQNPTIEDKKKLVEQFSKFIKEGSTVKAFPLMKLIIENDIRIKAIQ